MIAITSPAKTLNFILEPKRELEFEPRHQKKTEQLVAVLANYSPTQLKKLFGVSQAIAELNVNRFKNWKTAPTKPAILAYKGDIYRELTADRWNLNQAKLAQEQVRIMSGMYGSVRPYDLIKPYRLEMKTKLVVGKAKDLHEFWKSEVTADLNEELSKHKEGVLVDLASKEYSRVIDKKLLGFPIVEVVFKFRRKGQLKVVPILAKKARGKIIEFMVTQGITKVDGLEKFNRDGFELWERTNTEIVFVHD